MPRRIFLSHCGEDRWVALRLAACVKEVGADPFLDAESIQVGSRFDEDLQAGLSDADEILVLVTPWALTRPYVWMELGVAWFRKIPVVALLHGVTPEQLRSTPSIPIMLLERNLISLNDATRYFQELQGRA